MDDSDWRDWYEERAAILEFDGGYERWIAEKRARAELAKERQAHGVK